jgi:hypothetical protein
METLSQYEYIISVSLFQGLLSAEINLGDVAINKLSLSATQVPD